MYLNPFSQYLNNQAALSPAVVETKDQEIEKVEVPNSPPAETVVPLAGKKRKIKIGQNSTHDAFFMIENSQLKQIAKVALGVMGTLVVLAGANSIYKSFNPPKPVFDPKNSPYAIWTDPLFVFPVGFIAVTIPAAVACLAEFLAGRKMEKFKNSMIEKYKTDYEESQTKVEEYKKNLLKLEKIKKSQEQRLTQLKKDCHSSEGKLTGFLDLRGDLYSHLGKTVQSCSEKVAGLQAKCDDLRFETLDSEFHEMRTNPWWVSNKDTTATISYLDIEKMEANQKPEPREDIEEGFGSIFDINQRIEL